MDIIEKLKKLIDEKDLSLEFIDGIRDNLNIRQDIKILKKIKDKKYIKKYEFSENSIYKKLQIEIEKDIKLDEVIDGFENNFHILNLLKDELFIFSGKDFRWFNPSHDTVFDMSFYNRMLPDWSNIATENSSNNYFIYVDPASHEGDRTEITVSSGQNQYDQPITINEIRRTVELLEHRSYSSPNIYIGQDLLNEVYSISNETVRQIDGIIRHQSMLYQNLYNSFDIPSRIFDVSS